MKHVHDIAIIGMAGRFADARNLAELRSNLRSGRDSVQEISKERIAATTLPPDAQYRRAGYIADVDKFDHAHFNISLGEAQAMDPIMRLLLEVVHETIENAGYNPDALAGSRSAVFVGDASTEYYKHADGFSETLITGNSPSFFATRIAKQFNLTGSAVMINTACSSSGVAIHYAINELLLGEAEQAFVCGANLYLFPFYSNKNEMDIWSHDGKSRAFSADANGMSNGEIIAAVLLKPLEKALADGDHIHAVIKSSAINNNANRARSPYSPDSLTQAEVIRLAWQKAGVEAEEIGYIEAHGSGTQLGDSLEIEGLTRAFRASTEKTKFCPISTVKSNAGHGMSGAGLFGLIRTVLQLRDREIYPTVHFDVPNPAIDFEHTAVYVNRHLAAWPERASGPRIAGVTSLGASGTNVHVVVAEAPARDATPPAEELLRLFPISARTPRGLEEERRRLFDALSQKEVELADVAFTLGAGRKHYRHRAIYSARTSAELLAALARPLEPKLVPAAHKIVWLLSDHGRGMSAELAHYFPSRTQHQGPRASLLAFQVYALETLSFETRHIIPIGLGALAARVAAKELSFADALARAEESAFVPMQDLDQRLQAMVARQTENTAVSFVDLGGGSEVSAALTQLLHDRSDATVHVFSAFDALIGELYLAGASVDWETHARARGGRRIELPVHTFERTRCWIREAPRKHHGGASAELLQNNEAYMDVAERTELREDGTDIDSKLASIWCRILKVSSVSKKDNFFELGGDSIQATHIIHAINRELSVELDFEDMYALPTIEALAARIVEKAGTRSVVEFIWREVLRAESIQPADHFFDLGGHSLLANQVILKARALLGVELDFEDFFAHPTLDRFSAFIESRRSSVTTGGNPEVIERQPEAPHYALSSSQRRLWVLSQLEEGSLAYNSTVAYELTGEFSVELFTRALTAMVERHEILRTVFITADGEPRQKILPPSPLVPALFDLSGEDDPERSAALAIEKDERAPFDLQRGPLLRVSLMRLGEARLVLVITSHHLITDGWSAQVFFRETAALYRAFAAGTDSPLPALPIQYRDYAAWEQHSLAGEAQKLHEKYWLEKLTAPLPVLDLPADGARSPLLNHQGRTLEMRWPAEILEQIHASCRRENTTLFMFFAAALKALFLRYTEQKDIILGTPIAGRTHLSLESQIGYYANTIALRTSLDPSMTFAELLAAVKRNALEAFQHGAYPFDQLVDRLGMPRDLSRSAVFDVMLVVQNTGVEQPRLGVDDGALSFERFPFQRSVSQFDLLLELEEVGGELSVGVEYNTELFREERIERLLEHLQRVVLEVAHEPGRRLGELRLLSTEEERQLDGFNLKRGFVPMDRSVHHAIAERARLEPERIALQLARDGSTISYGALDRAANQLAHRLRALGAGHETPVVILMERGFAMVTTILAAWKTGGFYIPLDVREPEARLRAVLEEIGPSAGAVLVSESASARALAPEGVRVLVLAEEREHIAALPAGELPLSYRPESLAYTIFTSGSTGRPKGAMVEHRGMMNHLHAKLSDLQLGAASIIAQNATHTFDISVWQFFAALLTGGRTVIFDRDLVLDPSEFMSKVSGHHVNILEVVPSYLSVLLEQHESRPLPARELEYLLVTGEAVKAQLLTRWFQRCPSIPVVNAYGPTEASDDITHHLMRRAPAGLVPVGKPIQNMNIYVVDPRFQRLPIGVPGEICVAGVGVGRGYLNDPERTRPVFMDSPFADSAGERLYRTGDLGRFNSEGVVEFLGRIDHQVKIRGFRIELGEIEHQITLHPRVKETIVVDRLDARGEKELCAYVVAESQFEVGELKNYLAERLPSHMIPAHILEIPEMPLNNNGKVDRKALPAIAPSAARVSRAPETKTEEILLGLYRSILGEQLAIGTEDNFFELGGHSLNATQLAAWIHKELSVREPLAEIFKHPTIRELASIIDCAQADVQETIPRAERRDSYPLSPAQRRLYVLHQLDPQDTSYNMPQALEVRGLLDPARLERALNRLVERHDSLRTRFVFLDEPRQVIVERIELSLEYFTGEPEPAIRKFMRPFALETAPLLRAGLLTITRDRHLLLLDVHHIIADGISLEILVRDFMAYYLGEEPAAPELQYVDYSEWLRSPAQLQRIEGQRNYWLNELQNLPAPLDWPSELSRPKKRSFAGDVLTMTLPPDLLRGLKSLAGEYDSTLYMVLLATYAALLGRVCGREDLVIGTDVAGRDHADLESVIGMLVNTLAIRVEPAAYKPFTLLLAEVKTKTLGAITHQQYPFEELINALGLARDTSRNPLFDAFFALQNMKAAELAIPGLTLEKRDFGYRSAKFDLSLECVEHDGTLECAFEYCTAVLSRETVENLAADYRALLETLLESGDFIVGRSDHGERPSPALLLEKRSLRDSTPLAPQTETEAALLETWRELLGDERPLGIIDNFFDAGGHSLTAIQMVARVHQTLEVKIPLAEVFERPTVRELARYVDRAQKEGAQEIPPAAPADSYALSPGQERLYILEQLETGYTSYNISQTLEVEGELDLSRVEAALAEVIRRHESLRTSFVLIDDEPRQLIHENVEFSVERLDCADHFVRPFDLARAPLLRVGLIERAPKKFELLLDIHHLIADGVSLEILIRDFLLYYAGETPPPVRPYRDYSEWLASPAQRAKAEADRTFWLQELADRPHPLHWPADRQRPSVRSFAGAVELFSIGAPSLHALKELAAKNEATLYMVLLSAYSTFLGRICAQTALTIGTAVAGREHAELEQVVGMFVNTLAVRTEPSKEKKFSELLAETKTRVLAAFAHQQYPFERLVHELGPIHDLSRNPIFDAFFVLQNMKPAEVRIPGLKLTPREFESTSAKFDLSLECQEEHGALTCMFEYSTALFDAQTIRELIGEFLRVIEEIGAGDDSARTEARTQ